MDVSLGCEYVFAEWSSQCILCIMACIVLFKAQCCIEEGRTDVSWFLFMFCRAFGFSACISSYGLAQQSQTYLRGRGGGHPGTPVGLITRTLYVLHRSRAFHEVWCPKEIGRDSWVREATGVSVQRIFPQNWGKCLFSVVNASRFKTERPHSGID